LIITCQRIFTLDAESATGTTATVAGRLCEIYGNSAAGLGKALFYKEVHPVLLRGQVILLGLIKGQPKTVS
jgi:hypothetical protein